MGHCTADKLKQKSREKNLHPRWKTNREKNIQIRKLETKDTQKSLLFLFPIHPPLLERVTVKQIRSSYISSFLKMSSTETITQ